jgi:hypothetical protein
MRVAACVVALALATLVGAAAATADPPQRCASGSLRAWAGHSGVGLGTIYAQYGFLNVGRQTCVMRGFPAVTMLDESGRRMPTIVRRIRPGATGYGPVTRVTLRTGERAWFVVFFADETGYELDRCPTSARLRLTPPGDNDGVVLHGANGRITPYGGTVRHLQCGIVNVGPLQLLTPTNY